MILINFSENVRVSTGGCFKVLAMVSLFMGTKWLHFSCIFTDLHQLSEQNALISAAADLQITVLETKAKFLNKMSPLITL